MPYPTSDVMSPERDPDLEQQLARIQRVHLLDDKHLVRLMVHLARIEYAAWFLLQLGETEENVRLAMLERIGDWCTAASPDGVYRCVKRAGHHDRCAMVPALMLRIEPSCPRLRLDPS